MSKPLKPMVSINFKVDMWHRVDFASAHVELDGEGLLTVALCCMVLL